MFGICPCLGWQHLAVNQQIGKAVDVNMARIKKLETIQKLQALRGGCRITGSSLLQNKLADEQIVIVSSSVPPTSRELLACLKYDISR